MQIPCKITGVRKQSPRKRFLTEIDAYNRQDPKFPYKDREEPFEWVFSQWLSTWVEKLAPNASEALRIAARGQHIGRWTSPRESYPMDRGGYLRWREDLKKFHAKTIGEIMEEAGYDAEAKVAANPGDYS